MRRSHEKPSATMSNPEPLTVAMCTTARGSAHDVVEAWFDGLERRSDVHDETGRVRPARPPVHTVPRDQLIDVMKGLTAEVGALRRDVEVTRTFASRMGVLRKEIDQVKEFLTRLHDLANAQDGSRGVCADARVSRGSHALNRGRAEDRGDPRPASRPPSDARAQSGSLPDIRHPRGWVSEAC